MFTRSLFTLSCNVCCGLELLLPLTFREEAGYRAGHRAPVRVQEEPRQVRPLDVGPGLHG